MRLSIVTKTEFSMLMIKDPAFTDTKLKRKNLTTLNVCFIDSEGLRYAASWTAGNNRHQIILRE